MTPHHLTAVISANDSSKHPAASLLFPLAATTLGVLCIWKLYRRCFIHVHPNCVTIVYETRRRSILSTSLDKEIKKKKGEDLPQLSHFRPAMYIIGLLLYSSRRLVVVPPSSFFSTFTLPSHVLLLESESKENNKEKGGEEVGCVVEDINVTDGCLRMSLALRYYIPFDQLERYLAAVGPTPPNEKIAIAAAAAAKARGAELSVGLILNKTRRDSIFLVPFREHLSSKLMSEAGVKLIDATVESVEIIERQANE